MSRKSNRLKSQLRIAQERENSLARAERRVERQLRNLAEEMGNVELERAKLEAARRDLDRSVALRIKVDRDFDRPAGNAFSMTVAVYPEEFRYQFRRATPPGDRNSLPNVSVYADEIAHEAYHRIRKLLEDVISGRVTPPVS